MDILSTAMLGITAFFLITSALAGFARGAIRSILHLISVGAAFAIAWMGKDIYVDAVLSYDLGAGKTLTDTIVEAMGDAGNFASLVMPIIESLLSVLLFVTVFLVACLVTNIVYIILKIIFRTKSNKLTGLIVGVLQGALIAFAVCAPLNGLICNAAQIVDLEISGQAIIDAETKASLKENGIDFNAYRTGTISKIYSSIGNGFYNALAAGNVDGESVSLNSTVEAVEAGSKLVDAIQSITNIDMSAGLTADSREELRDTFKELNNIKNDMSIDAQKTMNTLISTIVSESAEGMEIPEEITAAIENLDFTTVDFEEEGDVLITVMDYANGNQTEGTEDDVTAEDIVNALSESTVIVPMLETMVDKGDASITLPDDQKEEFSAAINNLEDAAMADTLRKILGLN